MGHTLTQAIAALYADAGPRMRGAADDPLAPMRGIVTGVAISVLAFWLPLALVIAA